MSRDERKGFDYDKFEAEAGRIEGAASSEDNFDAEFDEPLITGDLPPFWKPEIVGEKRIGEVTAVRKTKDFGDGPGEAINLRGAVGLFALPISAGLVDIDWRKQIGRTFLFVFKGWIELSPTTKMRKFVVRPKRADGNPF